jgi:hypothetical protein
MITALIERAVVPFQWVTCDARYGEIPAFLDGIAALGKWYFAEVATDTRVWRRTPPVELPGRGLLGRPRTHPRVKRTAPPPYEMRELVTQVPAAQWQRYVIKEGSQGPLVAEFACLRVTSIRDELPGPRCWAIFRRTLGHNLKSVFLSNAPHLFSAGIRGASAACAGPSRRDWKKVREKWAWISMKRARGWDGIII